MPHYKASLEFKVGVVIESDDEGFHAFCPALKGLHTCGETKEKALENAANAAAAYLQSLIKHKDQIPAGSARFELLVGSTSTDGDF